MKACKDCFFCDKNLCRIDPPKIGIEKKAVWPEINPDVDWCGKFKSKSKAPRATHI